MLWSWRSYYYHQSKLLSFYDWHDLQKRAKTVLHDNMLELSFYCAVKLKKNSFIHTCCECCQISTSLMVSRFWCQHLGLGLESWRPRSWSQVFKKMSTTRLLLMIVVVKEEPRTRSSLFASTSAAVQQQLQLPHQQMKRMQPPQLHHHHSLISPQLLWSMTLFVTVSTVWSVSRPA